jgi:hypothetical protein
MDLLKIWDEVHELLRTALQPKMRAQGRVELEGSNQREKRNVT